MSGQQRAVLYIFVVFFAGVIAGALLMNVLEHVWIHPGMTARASSAPRAWDADRRHYMEQFRKELNLTDDQARQLEEILDETMRQYNDLHSFSHHIREDGLTRIRAILNDDQRKRFNDLTRKMDQDRAERKKSDARPGPDDGQPAEPAQRGQQPTPDAPEK